jgi:hypothetical protein
MSFCHSGQPLSWIHFYVVFKAGFNFRASVAGVLCATYQFSFYEREQPVAAAFLVRAEGPPWSLP